ncbi:MAG: hypothetical protein ACE5K0_00590 [Candidatus Methanofastidiosia archaeon]
MPTCLFCGKEKKTHWKTDLLIDYKVDTLRVTVCRDCRKHKISSLYVKALEKAAEEERW